MMTAERRELSEMMQHSLIVEAEYRYCRHVCQINLQQRVVTGSNHRILGCLYIRLPSAVYTLECLLLSTVSSISFNLIPLGRDDR